MSRTRSSPGRSVVWWLVTCISVTVAACGGDRTPSSGEQAGSTAGPDDYISAIHDVLAIDGELGTDRNHATESMSLAAAIRQYVEGIDSVDFSRCPEDFTEAFLSHRDSWAESISFFERFPNLRGEMHDLFEDIRSRGGETAQELEHVEAPIWDTWGEVEAVAADYGALEPAAGD